MPEGTTYNTLKGTDNNFTSITADPTASLTNGKFYLSNADAVHIVNLENNTNYDYYSRTDVGRGNEIILNSGVTDINIVDIDVTLGV